MLLVLLGLVPVAIAALIHVHVHVVVPESLSWTTPRTQGCSTLRLGAGTIVGTVVGT